MEKKSGLSLYLKAGESRELREGITITNEGSHALKVRIAPSDKKPSHEAKANECSTKSKAN